MVIEVLLALAGVLDPADDGSLRDALKLAVKAPASYLEQHPETGQRLIAGDKRMLPWLALTDGLMARHYAVELDHGTSGDDAAWSLSQLKTYHHLSAKTRAWLDTLGSEPVATVDCLRTIAARADGDGVIVAVMDIDSDSYIVLLLRKGEYEKAAKLAKELGFTLADIRGHDPNA